MDKAPIEFKSRLWTQTLSPDRLKSLKYSDEYSPDGAQVGVWPFVIKDSPFIREASAHDFYFRSHDLGTLPEDWTCESVNIKFYRTLLIRLNHIIFTNEQITAHEIEHLTKEVAFMVWAVNKFGPIVWALPPLPFGD